MVQEIFGDTARLAVLIDPDHHDDPNLDILLDHLSLGLADTILVGGSTSRVDAIDDLILRIKARTSVPVLLFPGNALHISKHADGLLLPSLISGRNPDYLIGKHVESARIIKKSGIEVIPMGYILVDGGHVSTTAYITNTVPIPAHLPEISADTALAGEQLGMTCIYLEAGSGAKHPVHQDHIKTVKQTISIPLIVGGGITTPEALLSVRNQGADMIVLGSILEQDPDAILAFHKAWTTQVVSR